MGAIDKSVKSYLKIPGIFAQLFNERFFDREHYIDPFHLEDQDSVTDVFMTGKNSFGAKEKSKAVERSRDVCMAAESGLKFRIILGVEEQTDIHYYMPVRIMLMDAMSYERQCRRKAAEARQMGEKISPVQGVLQGTTILPVMTVVLYLGEEEWDGPRELYDMFALPEGEKELLKRCVANYPIHLIDARHMSDEELEYFTDDLRIFFTALRENYDENKLRDVVARYPDTWYTLAVVKNDERYIEYAQALEKLQGSEGGVTMDATLDRIENRGFQRGISQGINQGIDLIVELCRRLTEDGRMDELKHSFEDRTYLNELLREYGLMIEENS